MAPLRCGGILLLFSLASAAPGPKVIWSNRLPGDGAGEAVLVSGAGGVVGVVSARGRNYRVWPGSDGLPVIEEIDETQRGQCRRVAVERGTDSSEQESGPQPAARDGEDSRLDLLVLYTPAAMREAGSAELMESVVAAHVEAANRAFANSGIRLRLRLVHAGLVEYQEPGDWLSALVSLRTPGDDALDQALALRNHYGADLVSLWVKPIDDWAAPRTCGIAYEMTSPAPDFESWAFSVVGFGAGPGGLRCGMDHILFTHELGHNMGAQHERRNAPAPRPGAPAFAFAFQQIAVRPFWRTIMAYDCLGTVLPEPCPVVNHFSNPEVALEGLATGVSGESREEADNARAINLARPVVEAFRAPAQPAP